MSTKQYIKNLLISEKPILISRFGATELNRCHYYLRRFRDLGTTYSNILKERIFFCCGFFPVSNSTIDEFSRIYLKSTEQIDALGI